MFKRRYRNISLNLGSVNTTVKYDKTDNLLKEPTVVAYDLRQKEFISYGLEAEKLVGRSPASRINIRPFKRNFLKNYDALLYFIKNLLMKFGPLDQIRLMISIPNFPNRRLKELLKEDLLALGVNQVYVDEELHAVAVYLEKYEMLKVSQYLLVDLGARQTSLASFVGDRLRVRLIGSGSDRFNYLIKEEFINNYGAILSNNTAEYLKRNFGTTGKKVTTIKVKAIEVKTGLPIYLNISSQLIDQIYCQLIRNLSQEIKEFIKKLPLVIQNHIMKYGIILNGGGSLLNDLPLFLMKETNLPVLTPINPVDSAVIGGWEELITSKKK
ncbi:rod shape-determining protein [Xylocopilactobacillus apicola]|uniref:MreB-like protein n=1 Tax=Xylocopilactobacillus apicola TaxID=2932184 RepID=A0AAU9DQW0_9LACO|nr:rod shape-determining protein [Xylocopilactobacillus apicola]BDR58294.1 MreB-like protein [Xylocopilactobacillus apicola]